VGPLNDPALPFAGVVSSLLYQANALGMRFDSSETTSSERQFSFVIETPMSSPITCEVSGWPDPSCGPATEHLVQASCGLMSIHGRASGRAQPLGLNYISTLTAALSLQGGLAAAIGQSRGLPMTRSQVSLAAAGLLGAGQYIAAASSPDAPEKILPGASSVEDRPPFVSADGVIFELETLHVEQWRAFWSEVGVDANLAGKGWSSFLLRYAKAIAPLPDALAVALSSMPFAQIVACCDRTGMSVCPTRSLHERAQDGDAESTWRQGPWFFQSGVDHANGLTNSGATDLPLSGVKVIESCRRIQGPLAGHLLTLLGADVLHIEPLGGDPLRGMPPMADGVSARYDALNRLKSVREIDIKSEQGQAEVKALVRNADVFLHNWAPGKAAPLNLDYADLARINPSLIYAYASGWGRSVHLTAPGTDFMAQAYSGVASKVGQASRTPGGSLFTVLDVLGGVVAAQGITIALLAGRLRQTGMKVDTSLLGSATLLCAEDLGVLLRQRESAQISPQNARPAIRDVYSTLEGLIAIECNDAGEIARLAGVLGLNESIDLAEFEAHLTSALLSRSAAEWMAIFTRRDIYAAIVLEDLRDINKDERLVSCLDHRRYTKVNSPWRFQ
jgi:CoA:oxalate CoA-transferase